MSSHNNIKYRDHLFIDQHGEPLILTDGQLRVVAANVQLACLCSNNEKLDELRKHSILKAVKTTINYKYVFLMEKKNLNLLIDSGLNNLTKKEKKYVLKELRETAQRELRLKLYPFTGDLDQMVFRFIVVGLTDPLRVNHA